SLDRPLAPRSEIVDDQDLDRSGDRDRCESAEHSRKLSAHKHRDEDREGREGDRSVVHQWLQDMVLDLLVDDEEDEEDDSGEERVQETDRDDDDGGDGRADQRYEVEQAYEEPERNREGD